MTMPGRSFNNLNQSYGYQGSKIDQEMYGNNNHYTTDFRQLDVRIGRWTQVDPVFQPQQSPYNSMDGNPVNLNDVLGLSTNKDGSHRETKEVDVPESSEGRSSGSWQDVFKSVFVETNTVQPKEILPSTNIKESSVKPEISHLSSGNNAQMDDKENLLTKQVMKSKKRLKPIPPDGIYYSKWVIDFTKLVRFFGGGDSNEHGFSYRFAWGWQHEYLGWRKLQKILDEGDGKRVLVNLDPSKEYYLAIYRLGDYTRIEVDGTTNRPGEPRNDANGNLIDNRFVRRNLTKGPLTVFHYLFKSTFTISGRSTWQIETPKTPNNNDNGRTHIDIFVKDEEKRIWLPLPRLIRNDR